ncbi:hypothetical protein PoB_006862300 [Plakobranchus ocellatus]|uniref:Uncharacterized protein n=1 Tax=Plakobranchus ocellatus TaxID=259542 RepID=A0AAV4DD04_9GAST|nr:hypothetical protein PoB_006862300 [Plakobranchus ocellatus]
MLFMKIINRLQLRVVPWWMPSAFRSIRSSCPLDPGMKKAVRKENLYPFIQLICNSIFLPLHLKPGAPYLIVSFLRPKKTGAVWEFACYGKNILSKRDELFHRRCVTLKSRLRPFKISAPFKAVIQTLHGVADLRQERDSAAIFGRSLDAWPFASPKCE